MNPRWMAFDMIMGQQKLDAIIITDPKHIYYLTGFASDPHERFLGLALIHGEEPILIVPALDSEAAHAASNVANIVTHTDTDHPYDLLHQQLGSSIQSLGIEKDQLTVSRFELLQQSIGAHIYQDIGPILKRMRAQKTPDEVVRMKQAIQLVEEVLCAGLTKVKIGVSELELVAELEYLMKKLGADRPSFETMVLSGPNTALPHGIPGQRKIQHGDLLMFDMGVYVNGYASDITRTFAIEGIDDELKSIYEAVLDANMRCIQSIRPGMTLASVDHSARSVIERAGYGPNFMHRLGHGLGMDVHEYPSIHGNNMDLVEAGMIFTVEPGVYVPGLGGVRIEDDIIVTHNGVDVLTSFPKELMILG
ncbi:M24 family metallopeptidase [Paenibacillus sp. CMAA1364]